MLPYLYYGCTFLSACIQFIYSINIFYPLGFILYTLLHKVFQKIFKPDLDLGRIKEKVKISQIDQLTK